MLCETREFDKGYKTIRYCDSVNWLELSHEDNSI